MSQEFDPYHRWLGIPTEDQPADHYRLLGLARFEDDVEVIRDAAERQMGHVRRYGLGKHSELSQRILNELGGAKACLLDPAKRAEYDAQLRERLAPPSRVTAEPARPQQPPHAPQARAVEPPVPPRVSFLPVDDDGPLASSGAGATSGRSLRETTRAVLRYLAPHRAKEAARRQRMFTWLLIAAGVLSGCAVVAIAVLLFALPRETTPPEEPSAAGAAEVALPTAGEGKTQEPLDADKGSVPATTRPLKFRTISDQVVEVGQELRITAELDDAGSVAGPLRYSLGKGAPSGAKIDPERGIVTWTPTREQAPRTHELTVEAAGQDSAKSVGQVRFNVEIRPTLRVPVLAPIPEQTVKAGEEAVFQVQLEDPEHAPQKVVFSLGRHPRWAHIDKASGTITFAPPESEPSGHFRMSVRVATGGPKAPHNEKELTVVVLAATPSPDKDAESAGDAAAMAALSITSPSAKRLTPSAWELKHQALVATRDLIDQLAPDSKVIPVSSGDGSGPLLGLSEYQKTTKALDGRTITFHPGKDPFTCRDAAIENFREEQVRRARSRTGASNQRGTPARAVFGGEATPDNSFDPRMFWREVRVETYVEYRQGKRHGVLATWDAEGRKEYWGQYERDQRHEFCCLFKNNQPAIVLVCNRGEVGAVHLIDHGKVARTFASEEEAQHDATARPLLDEINDFESRYQRNEQLFKAQVKKTIQARIGEINKMRRAADQSRRSARDAKQKENLMNLRKSATGQ